MTADPSIAGRPQEERRADHHAGRDAFTPETGYEVTKVDAVPLRDRLWLDREL